MRPTSHFLGTGARVISAAVSIGGIVTLQNDKKELSAFARSGMGRAVYDPLEFKSIFDGNEKSQGNDEDYDVCSVNSESCSEISSQSSLKEETDQCNLSAAAALLPSEFLWSANISPPTGDEAEVVLESLIEHSNSLPSIIPWNRFHELSPERQAEVCAEVRACVTSPTFIEQVRLRIEGRRAEHQEVLHAATPRSASEEEWEKLKEKYPCAICQDVLAAPVIFGCSHTFCGHCVQNMIDRCRSEENHGIEVIHKCPQCMQPIVHFTYERMLAANIAEEAQRFPTELKKNWEDRHRAYERVCDKERRRRGFYEHTTATQGGHDDPAWVNQLKNYWVPVLAFAVIVVIALVRGK